MDWLYEKIKRLAIAVVAFLALADALSGCGSVGNTEQGETATYTDATATLSDAADEVTETAEIKEESTETAVKEEKETASLGSDEIEEITVKEETDTTEKATTETAITSKETAKATTDTTTKTTNTAATSTKSGSTAGTTTTSTATTSTNTTKTKTATTESTVATSSAGTSSTTTTTSGKKKVWHEPVYGTRTVETPVYDYFPVYEEIECSICNYEDCQQILYTQEDIEKHFSAQHPANYRSYNVQRATGEYTYDIAYYETTEEQYIITPGYWEYID
jgi:hypothetical protein